MAFLLDILIMNMHGVHNKKTLVSVKAVGVSRYQQLQGLGVLTLSTLTKGKTTSRVYYHV